MARMRQRLCNSSLAQLLHVHLPSTAHELLRHDLLPLDRLRAARRLLVVSLSFWIPLLLIRLCRWLVYLVPLCDFAHPTCGPVGVACALLSLLRLAHRGLVRRRHDAHCAHSLINAILALLRLFRLGDLGCSKARVGNRGRRRSRRSCHRGLRRCSLLRVLNEFPQLFGDALAVGLQVQRILRKVDELGLLARQVVVLCQPLHVRFESRVLGVSRFKAA
mmetsp:Transcript_27180/g.87827  ORF Transcript_27180/g.87827 Transcript_27180/m.87827 type:complete len:219 (+) Transcript_27180:323-979(+)